VATYPGAFCDIRNFYATKYYPIFGDAAINWDAKFIPAALLPRAIREGLIPPNGLFFRSDSGNKLFPARVVYPSRSKEFLSDIDHSCMPSDIIMFCSPKHIDREWRILIVDGKAITGSQYHINEQLVVSPNVPEDVYQYVEALLLLDIHVDFPHKVFFMDIGESEGKYGIVEISAFGCAGLYDCDVSKVVKSVSEYVEALPIQEF
jgi:hypothetical protein